MFHTHLDEGRNNKVETPPSAVPLLIALALILSLPARALAQDAASAQSSSDQIGYKVAEGSEQKKVLLLREYQPVSMLHHTLHPVARAKFPVFDVHQHVNDAMGIEGHVPPAELIERMDQLNIKTIVTLTGMWGDKLQHVIDEMVKPYPGRFLVFTQLDWSKINDPDFSAEMVRQVDDGVRRGARGLKVLKDLGLGVRDKTGKLITVDDPRLDPVWEECGRLGIPVFIHSADPEAFFHPIDATNELYEQLVEHPDWSFYGKDFPTMESLLEARNRVFAKHPKTTFVSLHMGWPENLDWVDHMLAQHPNVYAEFGAREGELGRQPHRTRKLFLDYQDRILFGTDSSPDLDMYRNNFQWLETADEYFDYMSFPEARRWKIYGLELPDPVLEKIYHLNADRLFSKPPRIPN
jgi:uncharacterized protein